LKTSVDRAVSNTDSLGVPGKAGRAFRSNFFTKQKSKRCNP